MKLRVESIILSPPFKNTCNVWFQAGDSAVNEIDDVEEAVAGKIVKENPAAAGAAASDDNSSFEEIDDTEEENLAVRSRKTSKIRKDN